ncbi:MAG: hypothetical protein PVF43_14125 [Candidatus Eiseniibacteriota bacterium]
MSPRTSPIPLSGLTLLATILALAVPLSGLASQAGLIAHYPLQSDGLDMTGMNGEMTLQNAPFEEGGVYSSGIDPALPGGSLIETPELALLDFDAFAISAEFKIPADHNALMPVFVGGHTYRWMGVELQADRRIGLTYNNSMRVISDDLVSTEVWHRAHIVYDAATETGSLYLDDVLVMSETFTIEHGNVRNVSNVNFANGLVFRGHLADLKVYDSAYVPTPVGASTWGRVKALFE